MILHVYHCSLVVLEDYKSAPGQNRPEGTGRFPARPGEANVRYLPPTNGFGDPTLGKLLAAFQSIDLGDVSDSPVKIDYDYLEKTLRVDRKRVRALMRKARDSGLLGGLTINYDFVRWLRHSRDKGCLVVMTCVEESDLERDTEERTAAYCDSIDSIKAAVLSGDQTLNRVVIVPNGHLAPRSGDGLPWAQALEVLLSLPAGLERRGYVVSLNSYGYTKLLHLAINAHKLGYVLRVV